MTYFVYALGDPRTRKIRYVGCTTRSLKDRVASHIADTRRPYLNETPRLKWLKELIALDMRPLQRILETVEGDDWECREQHWIAKYRRKGADLTNLTSGGLGLSGTTASVETRRRVSDSRLASPTARKASQANIQKAIAARRGKPMSQVQKNAIRKSMMGKIQSDEKREKCRQANLGKKKSPEHIEKMRLANLGRKQSATTIAKRRVAMLGGKRSEETKERMQQARYAFIDSQEPRTHCNKGHKYTDRDFRPDGRRRCRQCENDLKSTKYFNDHKGVK